MRVVIRLLTGVLIIITGCVGTDILDDPIVPKKILLNSGDTAVVLSTSLQLESVYFNEYGVEEVVDIRYFNFNEDIVSVSEDGLVTPLTIGQARIYSYFEQTTSDTILVNIIGSPEDVASVVIAPGPNEIAVGSTITLTATAFNFNNEVLAEEVVWESGDTTVARVTQDGMVTGVADGITNIYAIAGGIRSEPYPLTVGVVERVATFMGSSGYTGEGTATLKMDGDNIILELGDDFKTDFALGTFIYLSNSTGGASTRANGLELGEVESNGAHTFNVSEIAATAGTSVEFTTYRYVIILCKPASITFGIADFES